MHDANCASEVARAGQRARPPQLLTYKFATLRQFGLIGFPLGHSFSKRYFTEKFEREGIHDAHYELFPLEDIAALPALLAQWPSLCGLNVTIPHKESVLPYLDVLDPDAATIGAVNCICFREGRLCGYNTDAIGFRDSLLLSAGDFVADAATVAYVLGNGGAAKAVCSVLEQLGVTYYVVSRSPKGPGQMDYASLSTVLRARNQGPENRQILVHTTPLGTFPRVEETPPVDLELLGPRYFVFDLIYNPAETVLLRGASLRGARTQNGLPMLIGQAEAAWTIWTT
jgi:shikimate dehydrogenase